MLLVMFDSDVSGALTVISLLFEMSPLELYH